jgi:aminoglycoside phosphotransferase (APT) family kinase protein
LWQCNAEGEVKTFNCELARERAEALAQALEDARPVQLTRLVIDVLSRPSEHLRPSHGDFHPMNLFLAPDRVTAIDLDTFALRDREADIGYCLAQTANFGLLLLESFEATEQARAIFLDECGAVDVPRVRAHMAWALLQSIHFDLCILKVKNQNVERIVNAAERLLHSTEVTLA